MTALLAIFAFSLIGFSRMQVWIMRDYGFKGIKVIGFHKIAWNSIIPLLIVLLLIPIIMYLWIKEMFIFNILVLLIYFIIEILTFIQFYKNVDNY